MKRLALAGGLAMLSFMTACTEPADETAAQQARPHIEIPTLEQHCFRNSVPLPNERVRQDVTELLLIINAGQVSGQYNWLPAYKDQRVGRFEGAMKDASDNVAVVVYDYQQEGTNGSETITIELGANAATVSGGPTELGLGATLARIEC